MFRKWFRSISAKQQTSQPKPKACFQNQFGLTGARVGFYLLFFSIWIFFTVWYVRFDGSTMPFVEGWNRWDADWYWQIWHDGYGFDPHTLVFMPGFPWLAGIISVLTFTSFGLASMFLNLAAFLIGAVIASEFVKRRFAVSARLTFLAQLSAPAAFYAFMPYSDSLFYLLFWIAITLFVRDPRELSRSERRWSWLLMLLLPMVRTTGFSLSIWLLFRRWAAAAVFLPLIVYLFMNYHLAHDPLFFLHAQVEFWMPTGGFLVGLVGHLHELMHFPKEGGVQVLFWLQITLLPILSLCLILLAAVWMVWRREWFLVVTLLTISIFSRNQSFWRSVMRYDLPLTALMILPWLSLARVNGAAPKWRRYTFPVLAIAFFSLLVLVGWGLQWGVGRKLHAVGLWGY